MSQKQRSQAVVEAHEFSLVTSASPDEVISVLDAAAASAAPGGMRGKIVRTAVGTSADALDTRWQMQGPGGVVTIMTFQVTGTPNGAGAMNVAMAIGDYKYQKGVMFSAPTLNGSKQIKAFASIVIDQLTARPSDAGRS